jgi:hypothetical protein
MEKRSREVKYRFDWKSVYLVPVMALAISAISIIAVVELTENPKVGKISKNERFVKNESNVLAFMVNL